MSNKLERKVSLSSLLLFSVPTVVMMLFTSFYTIIDGVFVARILGSQEFSAINIVYPMLNIVLAIGTMFGAGLSAIVGRKLGEGKKLEAKQDFSVIIFISVAVGVVIMLLFWLFLPQVLYFLGADATIYGYCYEYAIFLVFFVPIAILQLEFQSLFITNGTPRLGLIFAVAGGIANVVLDYVFMAVLDMGIKGASLATGLGMSIPALFGLFYFALHRKGNLCFVKPVFRKEVLGRSIQNGSSEMISNLSTAITTFLFNNIMMRLIGAEGVSAIGIILYIDFIVVAVSLGYSMGVAPLISYNYGKGDGDKLGKIYRISIRFNFVIGVIACVLTLLFANSLVSIFVAPGNRAYDLAVTGLRVFSLSYLYKGYNIFISSMFTAFSNGKVSAIISFNRTLVFTILFTIVFAMLIGVNGLWIGICTAEFAAFILSAIYAKKYKKVYHMKIK